MPGVITKPEVVCVFSAVVALVTDGPANVTLIKAVFVEPIKPPARSLVDCWMVKLPVASDPVVGVNFNPALPWAKVMKVPSVICVKPSFKNSVPPVMAVIWKFVVVPELGVMTRPDVVCVFSVVAALVTVGAAIVWV